MLIKIKLTSSFIIEKLRVAGGWNVDLVVVVVVAAAAAKTACSGACSCDMYC